MPGINIRSAFYKKPSQEKKKMAGIFIGMVENREMFEIHTSSFLQGNFHNISLKWNFNLKIKFEYFELIALFFFSFNLIKVSI